MPSYSGRATKKAFATAEWANANRINTTTSQKIGVMWKYLCFRVGLVSEVAGCPPPLFFLFQSPFPFLASPTCSRLPYLFQPPHPSFSCLLEEEWLLFPFQYPHLKDGQSICKTFNFANVFPFGELFTSLLAYIIKKHIF